MRALIITQYPKLSGVDYHRLWIPHGTMAKLFNVQIDQINEIDSAEDDFLKQYDFIVANRFLSKMGNNEALVERLKQLGVPYVLDLDDDYRIPNWHILYHTAKQGKHAEKIMYCAKHAALVTCTHERLAEVIKKEIGATNVWIIPNGIIPEGQFEVRGCEFADRVNFGWSGSVTHFDDVLEMYDSLYSMYKTDYKDKFRMVYGGYQKEDNISQAIAGVLTAKGAADKDNFHIYQASEVFKYGYFYDAINVSLIPLRDNRFNNMKSNLKLLEAGFKRKAVIISDVYPYKPMLKHGKNCLVVKNKNEWYRHMTKLINEPNMVEDLAAQLYDDVQDYHIDNVTETRYNAYANTF